jgi:hypothetical protein
MNNRSENMPDWLQNWTLFCERQLLHKDFAFQQKKGFLFFKHVIYHIHKQVGANQNMTILASYMHKRALEFVKENFGVSSRENSI